jgi:biopolymer transport protein ExbD
MVSGCPLAIGHDGDPVMSMDIGGAQGGLKADINVTPLVDVMLVLLIIMMLVAPMLQKGVDVKLPTAANTVDKPETQGQTVVAIAADRRVFLNTVQVRPDDLTQRVAEIFENKAEKIIIIKADEDVEYSAVMSTMDALRAAGVEDMGLITEKKVTAGGN